MESLNFIHNYAVYNNKLYFVAKNYAELMCFDASIERIKCAAKLEWNVWKADGDVYVFNDSIVVAAMYGIQVAIYHPDIEETENYIWKEEGLQYCRYTCMKDGGIWFFPYECWGGDIVRFDIESRTFKCVYHLACSPVIKEDSRFVYGSECGNVIFLNDLDSSNIFRYDMTLNTLEMISVFDKKKIFGTAYINGKYYLTDSAKTILYETDTDFNNYNEYIYENGHGKFGKPIPCQDGMLLFSADEIVFLKNGQFNKIDYPKEIMAENTWFFSAYDYDNKTILLPWTSEYIVVIDWDALKIVDYYKAKCPDDVLLNYESFFKEGEDDIKLNNFLAALLK